jgi:hypothetical protein
VGTIIRKEMAPVAIRAIYRYPYNSSICGLLPDSGRIENGSMGIRGVFHGEEAADSNMEFCTSHESLLKSKKPFSPD